MCVCTRDHTHGENVDAIGCQQDWEERTSPPPKRPTGNVTTRSPGVGLPKLQAPTTEPLQANRIGTTAPTFKEETEAQRGSDISPRSYSYQMAAGHSYTVLPKKTKTRALKYSKYIDPSE